MLRVLVVDDDRDTAESMGFLLNRWGHETLIARDGAAAVEVADLFGPDVVLLDLGLPRMDGFEVARRIRRPADSRPVIICVSGYGQREYRLRSRAAGCEHHLLKPADPEDLRRLLQTVEGGLPPAG
jgi:CheY-like chemotaxis protein